MFSGQKGLLPAPLAVLGGPITWPVPFGVKLPAETDLFCHLLASNFFIWSVSTEIRQRNRHTCPISDPAPSASLTGTAGPPTPPFRGELGLGRERSASISELSRNGFRDLGRSAGVFKAGISGGEAGPLRKGLLVGKLIVSPGEVRWSVSMYDSNTD